MSLEIQSKRLKYLECQQGDLHYGEALNFICLDSQCSSSGLICSVCRMKNHKNHKVLIIDNSNNFLDIIMLRNQLPSVPQDVIPLKIFLNELSTKMNSQTNVSGNIEELLEQLDFIQAQMMYSLKDCVEQLAANIKSLEEKLISQYKRIKERIITQSFASENIPKVIENIVNGEHSDVIFLGEECKKLIDSIQIINDKIHIDFQPEKVLEIFRSSQGDFVKLMSENNKLFREQFLKIVKNLDQVGQQPIKKVINAKEFTFSTLLKAPTIQIDATKKISTQTDSTNHDKRFSLTDQSLELTKKSTWAFKITHLSNWVGVGIAFKDILKVKDFKFDYNALGHGSYLISSNGYTWSHSKPEDNMQFKSFTFAQDDIIICEFDPIQKNITFKSTSNGKSHVLEIDLISIGKDTVHPCVNICNKDEKVEIVKID